jgi:hypothetical protein
LQEHARPPRDAITPCAGAASPPQAGAASPPRSGAASPPRPRWAGGRRHLLGLGGWGGFTSSSSAREGGGTFSGSVGQGGGISSLPRFLDGLLDAMHALEEEEALGFTSW